MKLFHLICIFFFSLSNIYSQDIVINEICSSNNSIITDSYGDFSDWIEIYNPSNTTINLKNYGLSDDENEPRKWIFPELEIQPNSFLLIFASGRDVINGTESHTNFKISKSGETLILTNSDEIEIDLTEPISISEDYSYARISDGNTTWQITDSPTPNASNLFDSAIICSHASGFYADDFLLELTSSNPNQIIYYTVNGGIPTPNSLMYETPISIKPKSENEYIFSRIPTTPLSGSPVLNDFIWKAPDRVQTNTVIRYAAFENGAIQSPIITKNYFIGTDLEKQYNFPVVNITTDSSNLFDFESGIYIPGKRFADNGFVHFPEGNYLYEGRDWERDVHISFFEKDGNLGFESDGGIRMHGNGSTAFPQKSFKVYFRNEYGQSELDYPIFSDSDNQKYKRLLFRSGGNDFLNTHFKDALLQNVISQLDVDLQSFQPSIVFINGEYWGIHNIREKYDRFHFQYNFGIDKDDVNVLKVDGRIEEGDNTDYLDLIDFVEENDLAIESNYEFINTQIDLSNFIDFQIAEIYFANYDWPCNNFKIWKGNDSDSKWRYAIYDLDYTFGADENSNYTVNSLEHATSDADSWPHCQISNTIFRNLLKNENFKTQFLNRFSTNLKNTFDTNRILDRIDDFETLFEPEMQEHIERWHYPKDMATWKKEIDVMKEFARERPCYMKEHLVSFFNLTEFDFDCEESENELGELTIFPNPSNGNFTLSNQTFEELEGATLNVFNISGQIVFSEENISIRKNENLEVKAINLPFGIYFVSLKNEHHFIEKRFVISRN